ncbi:hypothetical protein ZWY2020_002629 [Hordeum vulgare]|nr:hypothetical protein ZWY2020_002629 [Hordeum vulgare]
MVEATALRFGLTLTQKVVCNRLIINSDNMKVIETMKEGGRSAGATTAIFDDCFHFACDFVASRFEHCNTEANKVAHEFARLAKFSRASHWFDEPPDEVVSLLLNDVLIISNE